MKRCNNCGWFNLDSAECCEKCGDDSFDLEDNAQHEEIKAEEPEIISEDDVSLKESELNHVSVVPPIMGTVAYGSEVPVASMPKNRLAATVMDVSAAMDAQSSVQCPKCRYPITGFVEYCPNCGATIRNKSVTPPQHDTVSEKSSSPVGLGLKATIRDIPEELIVEEKDLYKLIPVDSNNGASIEMVLGQEIVVNGKRYRFQK